MTEPSVKTRFDATSIQQKLQTFAELSETEHGITRLGYTELERQAHNIFTDVLERAGAAVEVDTAGNTIATINAESSERAIGTGSHLDSVPLGGRFDGIVGVVAAMEVAERLKKDGHSINRPWKFVVFANEEGARFGQACNGSRAIAGLSTTESIKKLVDQEGVTLYQAMADLGLDPDRLADSKWKKDHWHAFVELHVEQGAVLQERNLQIGIVDSISGSTRLKVAFTGLASHTGATPMLGRRDALTAAAECVLVAELLANDAEHHGTRITVGLLNVYPNSITTIPGRVEFIVDIRDYDGVRQRTTATKLVQMFEDIAAQRNVGFEAQIVGDTSPVMLSENVVSAVTESVKKTGHSYTIMPSGASHDAQQITHITDVGMIFIPSRDGLSHVPQEWTEYTEVAEGVELLYQTLLRLDRV